MANLQIVDRSILHASAPPSSNKQLSGNPVRADVLSKGLPVAQAPAEVPVDPSDTLERSSALVEALSAAPLDALKSGHYLSKSVVEANMASLDVLARDISAVCSYSVRPALSIKTNPDSHLLGLALQRGWLVEAISQGEVELAHGMGFLPSQVVINGPHKGNASVEGTYAVFADSLMELKRMSGQAPSSLPTVVGVRLAPNLFTRFGVADSPQVIAETLNRFPSNQQIGIHCHYASSSTGMEHWRALAMAFVDMGALIQRALTGNRKLVLLDVGGGFAADISLLSPYLSHVFSHATALLPHLQAGVFEPGKVVSERAGLLLTQVVATREATMRQRLRRTQQPPNSLPSSPTTNENPLNVIVDGFCGQLMDRSLHPHPVLWRSLHPPTAVWVVLPQGAGEVLGRSCMENDTLAGKLELSGVEAGDWLAFLNTGAYDTSMNFPFGMGSCLGVFHLD
eukprot:NODE_1232_length_1595_cov_39.075613_g1162_i0.p1 GENE.NODE_1232_length_1595_cov_39.075613_g1162_i0~~NODE_1232_length_1595_cov_39.075613_g1162_i0.p1  ORF type:complete len:476 (+),score=75.93 NODE_1232_length_1595_cov_39.075613_g1162_i0:69-1430(+)